MAHAGATITNPAASPPAQEPPHIIGLILEPRPRVGGRTAWTPPAPDLPASGTAGLRRPGPGREETGVAGWPASKQTGHGGLIGVSWAETVTGGVPHEPPQLEGSGAPEAALVSQHHAPGEFWFTSPGTGPPPRKHPWPKHRGSLQNIPQFEGLGQTDVRTPGLGDKRPPPGSPGEQAWLPRPHALHTPGRQVLTGHLRPWAARAPWTDSQATPQPCRCTF